MHRAYIVINEQVEPQATVSDACVSFGDLDSLNNRVGDLVKDLTQNTDFFAYYRLNLFNKECPFWEDQNAMCGNRACAVITLDTEDDIPPVWRAKELSKLEGPKAPHPGKQEQEQRPKESPLQGELGKGVGESCVVDYDDECGETDYCVPEDEGEASQGDYVSLVDNPERFTGYAGQGANHVWNAIYRENCFLKPVPEEDKSGAAMELKNMLEQRGMEQAVMNVAKNQPPALDDECLEKRVFHRLISGMHASISTHLCWEYFDQKAGEWLPNITCYKQRLHDYPERISNLYFNFAVVSQAISKIEKQLQDYQFCAVDPAQNSNTREKVLKLAAAINEQQQPVFDESIMFRDDVASGLKHDFRNRFRNVSRLMDCIGCDKCRLWGKLQTAGYGAALKILFEFDPEKPEQNPQLRRTELVALFNTLGRLSKSVAAVRKFEEAIVTGKTDNLPSHVSVPLVSSEASLLESSSSEEAARMSDQPRETGPPGFLEQIRDEEDDTQRYFGQDNTSEDRTVKDDIVDEFILVVKAMRLILKSWLNAPRAM
ncbi:endoplasmic oxidoreductin-1 [Ascosphaera atra]|nr:endoplasmic oxidoreductin-1 [Ascosphaera atra]